jgi:hypothetical protein
MQRFGNSRLCMQKCVRPRQQSLGKPGQKKVLRQGGSASRWQCMYVQHITEEYYVKLPPLQIHLAGGNTEFPTKLSFPYLACNVSYCTR